MGYHMAYIVICIRILHLKRQNISNILHVEASFCEIALLTSAHVNIILDVLVDSNGYYSAKLIFYIHVYKHPHVNIF